FVDERGFLGHIARTEQQHAFTWQSVPACAPCLLIIALQIFREIIVYHEADVWFVDTHAKRDCRSDHPNVVPQERFLILRTLGTRQASVVRFRAYSIFVEISRQRVGTLPAGAVNDAAIVRPAANELEQLFVRRRFWDNAVSETWPVKAGDITPRVPKLQLLHDIGPHPFGSC